MNEDQSQDKQTPAQDPIDIRLKWEDRVEEETESLGDIYEGNLQDSKTATVHEESASIEEAIPVQTPELDDFEMTEQRKLAIEDALRQLGENPLPAVHSQLGQICHSMENKLISSLKAFSLLDEVDNYLKEEITRRSSGQLLDHNGVQSARSLILDALYAYSEASRILRQFFSSEDTGDFRLFQALMQQAVEFLQVAKKQLQEAAPYEPDDGD